MTAVPLRLLIEIISAEQDSCGNKEISFDELDQLMALSHNLVQWSFYSDFVISDYVDRVGCRARRSRRSAKVI